MTAVPIAECNGCLYCTNANSQMTTRGEYVTATSTLTRRLSRIQYFLAVLYHFLFPLAVCFVGISLVCLHLLRKVENEREDRKRLHGLTVPSSVRLWRAEEKSVTQLRDMFVTRLPQNTLLLIIH
jgi:hypothetical protein